MDNGLMLTNSLTPALFRFLSRHDKLLVHKHFAYLSPSSVCNLRTQHPLKKYLIMETTLLFKM